MRNPETTPTKAEVKARLDAELQRRLWTLFDAAKVLSDRGDAATAEEWAAFHGAVARVPEKMRPRDDCRAAVTLTERILMRAHEIDPEAWKFPTAAIGMKARQDRSYKAAVQEIVGR